jgi:hypothetical protein
MGSPRERLGRRMTIPVFALVLLLALSAISTPQAGTVGPGPASPARLSDSARDASFVAGNFSYCAPFGAAPAAIADLPNYTANVSALWSGLCNWSVYIAVINEWGGVRLLNTGNNTSSWIAANLSIQVSGQTGGIPSIYFVVQWGAPCNNSSVAPASTACSHLEYWIGNLSSNQLTGPFTSERVSACSCGPIAAASPFPLAWVVVGAPAAVASLLGVLLVLRRRCPPPEPPVWPA